jgi:uncharacterized membrane protein (DUF2068 family)
VVIEAGLACSPMDERKNLLIKHFGLRGVAIFEAGKGIIALVAGIWLLTLRHKDMGHIAERLLGLLHIAPHRHFSERVVGAAEKLNAHAIWIIFAGILVYVTVRWVEAVGLWLEKEWAEWFALLSGCLYLPWELYAISRHATALKWGIFLVNILIVLYMGWLLLDSHKRKKKQQQAAI